MSKFYEGVETILDGATFYATRRDGRVGDADGLFHRDTRYLSDFEVSLDDRAFSYVESDRPLPDRRTLWYVTDAPEVSGLPWETDDSPSELVLSRTQQVDEGSGLQEQFTVRNHSPVPISGTLSVGFDVDFADLFEVRGIEAPADRAIDTDVARNAVEYAYTYREGSKGNKNNSNSNQNNSGGRVRLSSTVRFGEDPDALEPGRASFGVTLDSQESKSFTVTVQPAETGGAGSKSGARTKSGVGAKSGAKTKSEATDAEASPVVTTGNADYDRTFEQAFADLRALTTRTDHGPVPVAGVPWYATVFGRDALIAAYQALPVAPELAVGTLRYLAAHQGTEVDEPSDERPGKILHEFRHGELARTGQIPFGPYYGTIDATLLWVVLLHESYRWLGDPSLVEDLWDSLESALGWIDAATDAVGDDPFLYYRSSGGSDLHHKAWRDSTLSMRFSDGTPASPPLASVEVQGYLYDALKRAATLLREVADDHERADRFEERAATVREQFEAEFWLKGQSFYAAARTTDGQLVDSVTSNVGQCLWSGIVGESRADGVIERLVGDDMFSGWGIRTTSADDGGYNPVSYHAGSVWPHDTSLVALGLARYGHHDAVERVSTGFLDASTHFPRHRLPEVFCGFDASGSPKPYPSTCVPQAWSAGAPFALLRALFSLEPGDGATPKVGREPSAVGDAAAVEDDAAARVVESWSGGPPKIFDGGGVFPE